MATAKKTTTASKPASNSPATKKSAAKKTAPRTSGTKGDAIALLTKDHAEVKKLFKQYQKLADGKGLDTSDEQKATLARQICSMLTVHATIEEEIFYPAAREALSEQDLLDEAEVEHASAKDLIAQIEASDPSDNLYDAKVHVLAEYIEHHVEEEEGEMFPKAAKSGMDLAALGAELKERKAELMAQEQQSEPAA